MSPRKGDGKKTRFTLWLPQDTVEELESLKESTKKASVAEVVREAIEVYSSLLSAREQGTNLLFENRKTGEKGKIWLLPGPPPTGRR